MITLAATLAISVKTVEFRLVAPQAKSVQIAGDYMSWDHPATMAKKDADWTYDVKLPEDARIEYKFVVDGKWILDPSNPKKLDNGVGGENSVYEGPAYHLHVPDGVPKHPLRKSTLILNGRPIVMWRPKNAKGLPILAYGDGDNYEQRAKIQNVVENLVESHKIRPVVIVLIQPRDRTQEYWQNARPYEKFFVESVLPAVRAATGASSSAKDVYVGGSSLGGAISLRLAEDYPKQIAGGVHSQSGSFQIDEQGLISKAAFAKLAPSAKLWLGYGTFEHELTDANERAKATLKSMGRAYGSRTTHEGHTWTAWRNRMVSGLTYLLAPKRN